jgi:hypothetical protein
MSEDAWAIVGVVGVIGAMVVFSILGIRRSLNRARARERPGYEALRDRLGLLGAFEWNWKLLAVDLAGTVDGVRVRLLFVNGGEDVDSWVLTATGATERRLTRAMPRGREPSEWTPAPPTGDPAFDAALAVLHGPGRGDAVVWSPEVRRHVAALGALPDFRYVEWSGVDVTAGFEVQVLPPDVIDRALRALTALARQ